MSDQPSMQNFLDIINGGLGNQSAPTLKKSEYAVNEADGIDEMKRILEGFRGAAGAAVNEANDVVKAIQKNRVQENPDAEQIADYYYNSANTTAPVIEEYKHQSFEIRSKLAENSNTRKEYDIVERYSHKAIVERLVIREAAEAIVKFLQKGYAIDHKKINEVLDFEEMYRRNRQDAATFKRRHDDSVVKEEYSSAEVYESRFQVSKANAIMAADHIKSILENIR